MRPSVGERVACEEKSMDDQAQELEVPCRVSDAHQTSAARKLQTEAPFQGLLESAPDAIVIIDTSGRIVLVNTQTELLFGYDRRALIGQPIEILLPERLRELHTHHRAG